MAAIEPLTLAKGKVFGAIERIKSLRFHQIQQSITEKSSAQTFSYMKTNWGVVFHE